MADHYAAIPESFPHGMVGIGIAGSLAVAAGPVAPASPTEMSGERVLAHLPVDDFPVVNIVDGKIRTTPEMSRD
jgi:hypothetical protein